MSDPCTCSLGADECDGQFGVFWPLQDGGSCAVRQCLNPLTSVWPPQAVTARGVPASAYLAKVEADPRRAAALQRARDRAAGVRACGSNECVAGQRDGVLCANGECDRENGVRPNGVATRHPRCGYPYCACVGQCFAASQPGVAPGVLGTKGGDDGR